MLVAYKGDTQQGPYEGAFLYTRIKTTTTNSHCVPADAAAKKAGLEPSQFAPSTSPAPLPASRKPAPPASLSKAVGGYARPRRRPAGDDGQEGGLRPEQDVVFVLKITLSTCPAGVASMA